jgi:hypothetical protein
MSPNMASYRGLDWAKQHRTVLAARIEGLRAALAGIEPLREELLRLQVQLTGVERLIEVYYEHLGAQGQFAGSSNVVPIALQPASGEPAQVIEGAVEIAAAGAGEAPDWGIGGDDWPEHADEAVPEFVDVTTGELMAELQRRTLAKCRRGALRAAVQAAVLCRKGAVRAVVVCRPHVVWAAGMCWTGAVWAVVVCRPRVVQALAVCRKSAVRTLAMGRRGAGRALGAARLWLAKCAMRVQSWGREV